ncbi:DNA polymerase processivity factor [Turkeypox virus]|uniref:DNA polymerase processivity factor n=1 Tax=Turkeypox virus TaxID=336486 RepID=A0A0M3PBB1_9POXV|nr:DNA polymerase processivity factor [Turkeypox virus]ALA62510.1 DNA polymerase processivity factor [Turkeypox virus]
MSKASDLSKLKELLSLKKNIRLLSKYKTAKYNELLDWAIRTYWFVGSERLDKYAVSTEEFYRRVKNNACLLQGKYYFMHRLFGNRYVFLYDMLYDKNTESEVHIDESLRKNLSLLVSKYQNILFIILVEYKNVFVIEDIVSYNNNNRLYEMLNFAKSIGLKTNEFITLRIEEKRVFTKEYYDLIQVNIKTVNGFYLNGILCIREDSPVRETAIIKPREFCCINTIKLEKVSSNTWLPYATTFNSEIVKISGFTSLVKSQLRPGSFISVIKYKNIFLLPEDTKPESPVSENQYIRYIMEYFKNEYFTIGNYMVKTGTTQIEQIDNEAGIILPYKNIGDLNSVIKDEEFVEKIRTRSLFDLTCDYFIYDREKIIKLINEMEFKLDDSNKIESFSIASKSLFHNDPSLEDIYMKFHHFVIIFNSLVAAKSAIEKIIP